MNPYIKPWSVEARRIPAPAALYGGNINNDANRPIIYECLNNATWGWGATSESMGGFGDGRRYALSQRTSSACPCGIAIQPLEEFIGEVLRHIDGTLYVHPRTGQYTLKLARADYTSSLMVLDASNILARWKVSRVRPNPN